MTTEDPVATQLQQEELHSEELETPSDAGSGGASESKTGEKWVDEDGNETESLTDDGGVLKTLLNTVEIEDKPPPLSRVFVHAEGKLEDGTVFMSSLHEQMDFILGKAEMCTGVEIALVTMNVGEKALVKVSKDYGYSDTRRPPKLPKGVPFTMTVELLKYEKEKDILDMSNKEKLELAKRKRDEGNTLYKEMKRNSASRAYEKAIKCLEGISSRVDDKDDIIPDDLKHEHLLPCYLNAAQCCLKNGDNKQVIDLCDKALIIDPTCIKGLFRRAKACRILQDFEGARSDFLEAKAILKNVPEISPLQEKQLQEINRELDAVKRDRKKIRDRMVKNYGGFLVDKNDTNLYADKNLKGDGSLTWMELFRTWGFDSIRNCFEFCLRRKHKVG